MLDGRVKTLHPRVHGGLLYIRGNAEHEAAVAAHGIEPIDMVVVNLYAFEKTAAQPGVGVRASDREHRYWRAVDGALGGEEF
jgi:phosphoribosylaminoimidazolecarboxamide formyltransferase / IMP cyclohydrolase